MLYSQMPSIDSRFSNTNGEHFTVIGTGTKGIVIEYQDGRVELIAKPDWLNTTITRDLAPSIPQQQ